MNLTLLTGEIQEKEKAIPIFLSIKPGKIYYDHRQPALAFLQFISFAVTTPPPASPAWQ
jgi:hypothetical protein